VDESTIHLFMLGVADIEQHLQKVAHGYRLRFSEKHLRQTVALPYVDYSSWSNESIGSKLFSLPVEAQPALAADASRTARSARG
jgi:hypothetical protein